jgi:putative protease
MSLNTDFVALNFLDESYDEVNLTVKAYKEQIQAVLEGRNSICEEGGKLLESLRGRITKGHFYRGVE